jgi:hypothetical protein
MPAGVERRPDRLQLGLQAAAAVALDRAAHLGERLPRDRLDLADLPLGARRVARHQLGGQLRLQHHDRERVAEQVVHVARDALALGDLGHVLDLVVREPQLRVLPPASAKWMFGPPDQQRDERRRSQA